MSIYLPDTDVSVTVELLDSAGNLLVPTLVEYRVLDEDDAVVLATQTVTVNEGDVAVVVTIPAVNNALPVGALRTMRLVEFTVTTASEVVLLRSLYTVESPVVVVQARNSFQTYQRAVMTSFELPNIPGWTSADESARKQALVSSWRKLMQYQYQVPFDETTLEDTWVDIPTEMIEALRRAQVLQADSELTNDEITAMRAAGLIASTVGESKQFLRSDKPLDSLICKRALREVTPYLLRIGAMIGRA